MLAGMRRVVTERADNKNRMTESIEEKPMYIGILLAAGKGHRFDPTGRQNKLLQVLPRGDSVVAAAARNLQMATGSVLIVVPPAAPVLSDHLSSEGYTTTKCDDAAAGMAASLVHAIRQSRNAHGWVIALGDMPFVQPETIGNLIAALAQGADIAVPVCGGIRGNPVAFSRKHLPALLQLVGDSGARKLVQTYPVQEVPVDDQGIFQDVDTFSDLSNYRHI